MRPHLYLRAYMAGIVVPTLLLLVSMTVFALFRFYFEVPSQFVLAVPAWPLARAIVFPMAIVPNAWGLWNMLFLALRSRVRLSLGLRNSTETDLLLWVMPSVHRSLVWRRSSRVSRRPLRFSPWSKELSHRPFGCR